jgi:hypothetical protein
MAGRPWASDAQSSGTVCIASEPGISGRLIESPDTVMARFALRKLRPTSNDRNQARYAFWMSMFQLMPNRSVSQPDVPHG